MIRSTLSIVSSRKKNTFRYNPSVLLDWSSTASYTKLSTTYTSFDDGYGNTPISLPYTFFSNSYSSTNLYVSTNGYVTIGAGSGNITSTPQLGGTNAESSPFAGNPSDQWLQPGLVMSDGDAQDAWYKINTNSQSNWNIKIIVFMGTYQAVTTPKSYLIELYRDEEFQWMVSRVKSNTAAGNAGPYNAIDVSQPSSQQSRVWRGNLNGQSWVYLGTGSVVD